MKHNRLYLGKLAVTLFGTALLALSGANAQQDEGQEVFELSPFEVDASSDMGYVATSTLTGSRLRTNLSDVAASVSVFTEEFMTDTGLTDMQEIAQYSVGTINNLQDINAGPDINNYLGAAVPVRRVRVRGIRATKGIDYFQTFIPDDGYKVERYDESRGPNGILFGISEAGGIINSTTLRASTTKDSGRLRYSTGSYQRNRAELRLNKVLIDDVLGVTVAGLYQDNEGWRDFQVDERERIYGAIKWQPTDRLTIQAMGESGDHWGTRIRPYNASDRFLPWYLNRERFGVEYVTFVPGDRRVATTLGDGQRDGDSADYRIDSGRSDRSGQSLFGVDNNNVGRNQGSNAGRRYVFVENDGLFYNSAGQWESEAWEDSNVAPFEATLNATSPQDILDAGRQGSEWRDTPKILDFDGYQYDISQYGFEFPTHLNAGGPDMYRAEDFSNYTIMADYRITDNLFVNFAHNHQEVTITAQFDDSTRPELRGDPNLSLRHEEVFDRMDLEDFGYDVDEPNPWAGQIYFESQWRYQTHTVEYDETRAAISYDLDFNDFDKSWLGRHRIAAGWAKREVSDEFLNTRHAFLGNPFDFQDSNDFDDNRNRIYVRNYITEGDFSTYVQASPLVPGGQTSEVTTEDGQTYQIGWANDSPGTGNARSDIEVDSKVLALQNYLWSDRIITTFGWREDEAKNIAFGHERDPLFGDVITTDPGADGYRVDDPIVAQTKTAGVVIKVTDNFSLLANWATSIGLPEFRNVLFPNAGIADPVEGEGYDIGIGFNLMEDRISGRLVYFDGEAINRTSSGGGTRIISDPMWQSMRAIDELRLYHPDVVKNPDTGQPYSDSEWESEIEALNGASGGVTRSSSGILSTPAGRVNSFLQDEYTEGWEVSLTANITRNWRLTLNASYTDRVLLNYGREFARSSGFQKGEDGRWIQAVDVSGSEATAVNLNGTLAPGGIHTRILEIAQAAEGVIPVWDDDDDEFVENVFKTIDPNATTVTIDSEGNWVGPGALIINTDTFDTFEEDDDFNYDETVAYRLWESMDQLQLNNDEREKRWGLNPWKFNMFTAYDFKDGPLDGVTIGGGYRYLGGTVIGEDSDGVEFTGPSQSYFDLLLRFRHDVGKKGRIEYQVNVYNLFDNSDPLPVRYVNIDDPTLPYSRYLLRDPRTIRFTVTYSF